MKTKNVTFSMPIELVNSLHAKVGKRDLSKFVCQTIEKALAERANKLKSAYAEANEDPGQNEVSEDWKFVDNEGWDE